MASIGLYSYAPRPSNCNTYCGGEKGGEREREEEEEEEEEERRKTYLVCVYYKIYREPADIAYLYTHVFSSLFLLKVSHSLQTFTVT